MPNTEKTTTHKFRLIIFNSFYTHYLINLKTICLKAASVFFKTRFNVLVCSKFSGVCRCNNGYIGEDCSYNTSYPPTEISFPFYGLCKLRTRACKATNVFGEFHSTFIWGKRRHFQVYQITWIFR